MRKEEPQSFRACMRQSDGLDRALLWFSGMLFVSFSGTELIRFFNLCHHHGIAFWQLGQHAAWVSLPDFRRMQGLVKKTRTRVHIQKRRGAPFLLQQAKRHSSVFLALGLFFFLLWFGSLFIWDISVEGGERYTSDRILSYLETQGVGAGCWKKRIDCEKLEKGLRNDFPDIGWASVAIAGTRMKISLVETKMPEIYKAAGKGESLVAGRDGVISSMITRTGTPLAACGQSVKKGDVLVLGEVLLYGEDYGGEAEPVTRAAVAADADICIDFVKNYQKQFSLKKKVRVYTGEENERLGLSFLDWELFLPSFAGDYEKKETVVEEQKLYLTDTYCLPISIKTKIEREYREETVIMTKEAAETEGKRILMEDFKKLEEKGVSILENRVTIEVVGSKCKISGKLLCREKVAG